MGADRCETLCDDDCTEPCHEVHQVTALRTHDPDTCMGIHYLTTSDVALIKLAAAPVEGVDFSEFYDEA